VIRLGDHWSRISPRARLIVIVIIFIALIAGATMWLSRPVNPYGSGITIANYDQYVKDFPADRRQAVDAQLLTMARYNTPKDAKAPTGGTATIRDKSATDQYNATTNLHTGSFIVDIPALKQSYVVQYEWSLDPSNPNYSGYPLAIHCPTTNDVIYSDTTCKELPAFTSQGGQ